MKNTALKYLDKNKLLYMGIIEPIRKNTADILYAGEDGVLIKEKNSGAYMIAVDNLLKGQKLLENLDSVNLIVAHDKAVADYIQNKFKLNDRLECVQAVYLKNVCDYKNNKLQVKKLGAEHIDILTEHYDILSEDEIKELLKRGNIFGGYKEETMVGFVGMHLEGSLGLLNVFPEYRKSGYGTVLESFMINYMLNKGDIPFAQIETDNKKSLLLQKKLGFDISKDKLYWMF
ncbi:MAG: GNAT family N-acetyltransferase [Clostridium sp.]